MGAFHDIPERSRAVCEQFVGRLYGKRVLDMFSDALVSGNRGLTIQILEEALSDKDEFNMPVGLRGLPSERLTAKRVIGILENQGPDLYF